MLLRFSAANFLSIDGELELSLVATRETQHGERLAETKAVAHRLLQAAAIWGGNAAGKSNLCKVLEFAQRLIVKGTRPDASTGRIPFRLRENAGKEPTRLSFDILLEIDGGVKTDNIAEIARAGADTFVAGSAVFGAAKASDPHRYDTILGALRAELAAVKA